MDFLYIKLVNSSHFSGVLHRGIVQKEMGEKRSPDGNGNETWNTRTRRFII